MKRLWARSLVGTLSACASVTTWTRPDYETKDRKRVLRLVVVPQSNSTPAVTQRAGKVALRYANHHRDFIVREVVSATVTPCQDDLEGVLSVNVEVASASPVGILAKADLKDCGGTELWRGEHESSYPSADDNLKELTDSYVEELGEEVRPFVSPVFQALRRVLDELPVAEMPNDDYVMEKIELEE